MVLAHMPNISTETETACLFSGLNKCVSLSQITATMYLVIHTIHTCIFLQS